MLGAIHTLPSHIPLKWLMLLVPLMTLLVWHYYQHQAFSKHLHHPSPKVFRELLHAARWRTAQVAGIWVLALLLIAGGDIRYYSLLAGPQETDNTEDALEPLDFQQTRQPAATNPVPAPTQAATATPSAAQENKADDLKFRYEDAFVSYFYLQRCKHADVADLSVLNNALAKEVAAIGATSDVQLSIFSAAQGSFESIYADTPCDTEYLEPVARQFETFMQKIR